VPSMHCARTPAATTRKSVRVPVTAPTARSKRRLHRRPGSLGGRLIGQFNTEQGPLTRLTLNPDPSAVSTDDLLCDKQPQAESANGFAITAPLELSEDPLSVLSGHARPLIAHLQQYRLGTGLDTHLDSLALPVTNGIGQQVGKHLLEAKRIPATACRPLDSTLQFIACLAQLRAECVEHLAGQLRQVAGLRADR